MTRLLCIGECMLEMSPTVDGTFNLAFAGDTFNTAWYAQRIGAPDLSVSFLSAIGDDEPSARMRAFIESAGIEPVLSVRHGSSVGLYMISLVDSERSFSYWRSASAARSLADDLNSLPKVASGDVAYFSGITMAILPEDGRQRLLKTLQEARQAGVVIAFDPNLRPRLWNDIATMCDWIMRAASVADIVLPSFEDEQAFFNDANISSTASRYAAVGAKTIVVKDGSGPLLLSTTSETLSIAPNAVTEIVDTTAAGDSFNAGFLVAMTSGDLLPKAVESGCNLAAKVIAGRGALVDI